MPNDSTAREADTDIIPVIEERARIVRRKVVTGRVRIETQTEEIAETIPADLLSSDVEVVRVPVDRCIDAVPDVVETDGVMVIPVVEERLVVTRELYLREEIHVRRIEHRETLDVPVTTRRQTVRIDRLSPDNAFVDPQQTLSKDEDHDL